jgi:hypothetical protein
VSAARRLFRFAQLEFPFLLGPADGRYLLRPPAAGEHAEPQHVLVLTTLGAPQRHALGSRRSRRRAAPDPAPAAVATGRATVIDVATPMTDQETAARWLAGTGEEELERSIAVLNHALHAFRLATADPYLAPVARRQALVARLGYGHGEQVADGDWTDARELVLRGSRRRRAKVLAPQARLAAALGGRENLLVCQELALRARLDLDQQRHREAALQLLVALDAAIAELQRDPAAAALAPRLKELRRQREVTAGAAQSALAGPLTAAERETVAATLEKIEAALRARALASA